MRASHDLDNWTLPKVTPFVISTYDYSIYLSRVGRFPGAGSVRPARLDTALAYLRSSPHTLATGRRPRF